MRSEEKTEADMVEKYHCKQKH